MLYLVVEFCRSKKIAEDENLIAKFGVNYTCSNVTHPATGLRKFEEQKTLVFGQLKSQLLRENFAIFLYLCMEKDASNLSFARSGKGSSCLEVE